MLSKLMQVNTEQEKIIIRQAGIIDELFALVCQYTNLEMVEGLESLLTSIGDVAEMTEKIQ